jgi:hypothetical protein
MEQNSHSGAETQHPLVALSFEMEPEFVRSFKIAAIMRDMEPEDLLTASFEQFVRISPVRPIENIPTNKAVHQLPLDPAGPIVRVPAWKIRDIIAELMATHGITDLALHDHAELIDGAFRDLPEFAGMKRHERNRKIIDVFVNRVKGLALRSVGRRRYISMIPEADLVWKNAKAVPLTPAT